MRAMQFFERFVRFPTPVFERLLHLRMSGVEWRMVLWTVRETFGWHRATTPYSWYRIAKELSLNRSGVVRAGKRLIAKKVLLVDAQRLGLGGVASLNHLGAGERPRLTPVSDDTRHRKRGQPTPLSRRIKDRSKDRNNISGLRFPNRPGLTHNPPYLPGAARPVPGKYDHLTRT